MNFNQLITSKQYIALRLRISPVLSLYLLKFKINFVLFINANIKFNFTSNDLS